MEIETYGSRSRAWRALFVGAVFTLIGIQYWLRSPYPLPALSWAIRLLTPAAALINLILSRRWLKSRPVIEAERRLPKRKYILFVLFLVAQMLVAGLYIVGVLATLGWREQTARSLCDKYGKILQRCFVTSERECRESVSLLLKEFHPGPRESLFGCALSRYEADHEASRLQTPECEKVRAAIERLPRRQ